ncbi:unnamed protein product (mitochondrion) [Plasmodiophora brassicae]|uniref:Uncharacterized protein n=1 Tax=Plasmodiophora brassicae TaxID=37360 RepID=A0A0G4IQQ9_PLABS|nr:hypothetical protein PBRA_000925 [Plasmodiophora brassicae]SPQ97882.1 unnamed protein product [Plasmodiophora brassicae]
METTRYNVEGGEPDSADETADLECEIEMMSVMDDASDGEMSEDEIEFNSESDCEFDDDELEGAESDYDERQIDALNASISDVKDLSEWIKSQQLEWQQLVQTYVGARTGSSPGDSR